MATITTLTAAHRAGQTFLTWDKNGITGPFSVYRHTSQITSGNIGSATLIATVDEDSWRYLHDDSADTNLTAGFIIEDEGTPLTSSDALLVWTTATSGTFYYAVIHGGDSTVTVGVNSLTSGVVETAQSPHGYVICDVTTNVGGTLSTRYRCFRWHDYSAWHTEEWGYYGNRFDVWVPESYWETHDPFTSPPFPLVMCLHGAGNGYFGPTSSSSFIGRAVFIQTVDLGFVGVDNPYTTANPDNIPEAKWFGRVDPDDPTIVLTITERWLLDLVVLVRDDAFFQIDENRVYIDGASKGSGSMHVASHHPDYFAACRESLPWPTDANLAPINEDADTITVDSAGGPTWENWQSMIWMASYAPMIPMVHTFRSDDSISVPLTGPNMYEVLDALNLNRQPYAAEWRTGGHAHFYQDFDSAWDVFRFKKNEAYPCFSNASTDDAASGAAGMQNILLDWHSELHEVVGGSAIVDTADAFEISLFSLDGTATADVTIRNQQSFTPAVGSDVTWDDGTSSGTVQVGSDGEITIEDVTIEEAGTRLELTPAAAVLTGVTTRTALRHVGI